MPTRNAITTECHLPRNSFSPRNQVFKESQGPLASSLASVQVDFNTVDFPDSPDTFQNDGASGRDRKSNQDPSLLSDILIGIPLNDEKKLGIGGGDSRPNKSGILSFYPSQSHSALEIGMYVLLSTFCFAIVVFVVSCFVYASKHKMINVEHKERTPGVRTMPSSAINRGTAIAGSASNGHFPILRESRRKQHRESTTNAHNWVWLGRSTMDHSSIIQENGEHFLNPRGESFAIHHTNNDHANSQFRSLSPTRFTYSHHAKPDSSELHGSTRFHSACIHVRGGRTAICAMCTFIGNGQRTRTNL